MRAIVVLTLYERRKAVSCRHFRRSAIDAEAVDDYTPLDMTMISYESLPRSGIGYLVFIYLEFG